MKKSTIGAISYLLLLIYVFNFLFCGNFYTKIECIDAVECYTGASITGDVGTASQKKRSDGIEVGSRLFELLFGKGKDKSSTVMLYPGGGVFGLHIQEDGITVTTGSDSKIFHAGDRIIGVGGVSVGCVADIENAVKESGGKRISFDIIRGGERMTVSAAPTKVGDGYKLGIKLRAETAGIGTVTYVVPETLEFGGLGHAVTDSDTGAPVSVKNGRVKAVMLGGIKRGEAGKAGELAGVLKNEVLGQININCECGVFGSLTALPGYCTEPMPAADRSEITCGTAEIISTLKNGYREKYAIEISDVDMASYGSKSFKIKVTDPALIAITGGIVRGMSGSPIIQNGKLVGAVTHVLINDPTTGYGIFIENMLNASVARNELPKSA